MLLFVWLAGAGSTAGQVTTATILGTVADSTGGMLPGATVIIKNTETGLTRTAVTDSAGRYRESQLPVGLYTVTANLEGFGTQVRENLRLTVGGEVVVNFTLGVSELKETVVVSAGAQMVQTSNTEVATLVDERMIRSLPLNARDIQQLAVLQPGVQQNNYHNFGTQMVVSGTRPEHNRFLLNGVDMTFTFTTSPVSAAGIVMGVEAVEEFKLMVGQYSAAYGEKAGGVMNTVTKSGTNNFRGTLYEFHRNDKFDTKNYFDRGENPPFNRNQFGISTGGPILRNRTFFFANYEGFRQKLGLSHLAVVPDARARLGYLPIGGGGETFVGVAPSVLPYLALMPEPNGRNFGDGTAEFFSNPQQDIREDFVTVRIDQHMGERNQLYGVYTGDWSEEFTPSENPNFAEARTYNRHLASVQNVHTFSQNFLNTTRLGLNKTWYFHRTDTTVPIDRSLYFVKDPFYAPTDVGQFGQVSITGLKGLGEGLTGTTISPRWFDYTMVSLNTDFTYTRGAHSLQFGAVFKHTWDDTVVANPASRGQYTFLSLERFLQGRPATFGFRGPDVGAIQRNWRNKLFGVYVEDNMRARQNLTINAGVRYEMMIGPSERDGKISNLRGGLMDPAPTVGQPYFEQPRDLIAPRFGLNWDVFGDGRTSLRGGAGVFYDQINTWYYFLQGPSNGPFSIGATMVNPPFPNAVDLVSAATLSDFGAVQYDANAPVKYSYDVTLQREVGHNMAIMVAYVGSQSRHLGRTGNLNLFGPQVLADGSLFWPATGGTRPNPKFRSISILQFDANSFYDSFQITLDRRAVGGLGFRANYTLSSCTDDVSNEFGGGSLNGGASLQYAWDRSSSRGPCSFNNRHSANITTTWELPGRNLGGALGAIFGGWQWNTITSLRSGVPFELSLGYHNSRQGELGAGPDRPSWAPGCDADHAILGEPEQWFDPKCFVPAPPGMLGNVGSRVLTGPGLMTSDWSFSKFFEFAGSRRLELRAEVFNVFNRANFSIPTGRTIFRGGPNNRVASAGVITRTITPSRQAQFGVKFSF